MHTTSKPEGRIGISTIVEILQRSRASLYRDTKNEALPKPLKLGHSSRRKMSEVMAVSRQDLQRHPPDAPTDREPADARPAPTCNDAVLQTRSSVDSWHHRLPSRAPRAGNPTAGSVFVCMSQSCNAMAAAIVTRAVRATWGATWGEGSGWCERAANEGLGNGPTDCRPLGHDAAPESGHEPRLAPDDSTRFPAHQCLARRQQCCGDGRIARRQTRRPRSSGEGRPADDFRRAQIAVARGRVFSDIEHEGSATSQMTSWGKRRSGVARP